MCFAFTVVIPGEVFEQMIDKFLRNMLRKGVPPAFTSLRGLYQDPAKVAAIERIALNYRDCLDSIGRFSKEGKWSLLLILPHKVLWYILNALHE